MDTRLNIMVDLYKNKTFCLIGDSIMEHGFYTYNLRAYFQNSTDKCYFYNRGVAGNRAIMAQYLLDDDVFWTEPDYAVICFGANDMGVWLYDSLIPVTDEILSDRKKRDDEYILAHQILIDKLKENGIKPIIMSPYCVDEFITETEDVQTVTDNDEKEVLRPSFYKRKTFQNINEGFKGYNKRLKELAEKNDVIFWDMFSATYEKMLTTRGLYFADGIHYSKDSGHALLANIILGFLGCDGAQSFEKTVDNDKVFELEQFERSVGFISRCTPMNAHFGVHTEKDVIDHAEKVLADSNTYERGRFCAENYLKHHHELDDIKQRLKQAVKSLY